MDVHIYEQRDENTNDVYIGIIKKEKFPKNIYRRKLKNFKIKKVKTITGKDQSNKQSYEKRKIIKEYIDNGEKIINKTSTPKDLPSKQEVIKQYKRLKNQHKVYYYFRPISISYITNTIQEYNNRIKVKIKYEDKSFILNNVQDFVDILIDFKITTNNRYVLQKKINEKIKTKKDYFGFYFEKIDISEEECILNDFNEVKNEITKIVTKKDFYSNYMQKQVKNFKKENKKPKTKNDIFSIFDEKPKTDYKNENINDGFIFKEYNDINNDFFK